MTGQTVMRAWGLAGALFGVAVIANVVMALAQDEFAPLLIIRGLGRIGALICAVAALVLTVWWFISRHNRSAS